MINSRLVEVLRTFNKEEIKEFEKFLASPFFKKQRNLIPLFKLLKTGFPDFKNESLEKGLLFKKLYAKEKYNDQIMRTLSSEMLTMTEEFLVQIRLRKNKSDHNKFLMTELGIRNPGNMWEQKIKKIEKSVRDKPPLDENTIFELYEIDNSKTNYYLDKNDYEVYCKAYEEYSEHFTVLSILKLIKSKDQFLLYSRDYNINFGENLISILFENVNFDAILEKAEKISHPYFRHLKIFYLLHKIHISDDEKIYKEVKEEFLSFVEKFGHEEKYHIFTQMEIYCINKIHAGKREFYDELFDIYDLMIINNAYTLTPEHNINAMTYRNMLITSLKVNKHAWLKNIIEKVSETLSLEWKENMRNFAYAHYFFETGEYIKALASINKVPFELFTFKADVKNITLKIYYELNYFEQAISAIDSYRHYIASNNIMTDPTRDYYKRFVKIYFELLKAKMNSTKIEKKLLFSEEDSYPEKEWMLQKADEL
ncbi:hypothetical protein BH10BAC5_BH10BAC5_20280 [soil metagenome]